MRRMWVLVAAFMVLNAFDAFATLYAIRHGYAYEANPICRWTMTHGVFLPFKALNGCGTLVFCAAYKRGVRRPAMTGIVMLVGLYGLLAIWHVFVYCTVH